MRLVLLILSLIWFVNAFDASMSAKQIYAALYYLLALLALCFAFILEKLNDIEKNTQKKSDDASLKIETKEK